MSATVHSPAAEIAPEPFVRDGGDGTRSLTLLVAGMHCGGCVQRIEDTLAACPGVVSVRANLTTRRVALSWRDGSASARELMDRLAALGYTATPFAERSTGRDAEGKRLMRALAVAGFAAANVMLLSVALWAGAFSDMDDVTRQMFHWVSALIVLPASAYAIGPFARPALAQLRHGAMGMDLPITVAVISTLAVSLWETLRGGAHVYFEAAAMLLFFLLIGRVLDQQARARAGRMAENLLVLRGQSAVVLDIDGRQREIAAADVVPGMRLLVAAGARIVADGVVESGQSDVDNSLISGESLPLAVAPGGAVLAGTLNATAPLVVRVGAAGDDTVLAGINRLMEAALQSRGRYVRLADRVVRIYAPWVHVAAVVTFLGWWGLGGVGWQPAVLVAVSVLIITCPCALGLAVPVVQVVAHGRLLGRGIVLKSADGLERLAEADHVVFDKTGTLTEGALVLANGDEVPSDVLAKAASLAAASRHPLARALVRAMPDAALAPGVVEHPGRGLAQGALRLGARSWALSAEPEGHSVTGPELWLAGPDLAPICFRFSDEPRADVADTVQRLHALGLGVEILSGDQAVAVAPVARVAGIETWQGAADPAAKLGRLRELAADGRKVLMVGDGLNDAPALAAAHVSMSPAVAADISQAAADLVFQGHILAPVVEAIVIARRAQALARGNIALAVGYNALAVPLAMAGLVTPLIAAAAMSASSLVVTLNALRLARAKGARP